MIRLIQPLIIASLIAVLGYNLSRLHQLSSQNQDLLSLAEDTQLRLNRLQKQMQNEHVAGQTALMAQQSRVESLKQGIAKQTDVVSSAQARLDSERTSRDPKSGLSEMREALDRQKQIVSDLQDQLASVKSEEGVLAKQGRNRQTDQNSNQRLENTQLGDQISAGTLLLEQLKQQLSAAKQSLKKNQFDQDLAAKVQSVQVLITNQRAALDALKNQRSSDNDQWNYQKGASKYQDQQQLQELGIKDQEITSQLGSEKQALKGLEADVSSGVKSLSTRQSLVKSAQADLHSQKAQLENLQNQLQTEQTQLERLQRSEQ